MSCYAQGTVQILTKYKLSTSNIINIYISNNLNTKLVSLEGIEGNLEISY